MTHQKRAARHHHFEVGHPELAAAQRRRGGRKYDVVRSYSPKSEGDVQLDGSLHLLHQLGWLESDPRVKAFELYPYPGYAVRIIYTDPAQRSLLRILPGPNPRSAPGAVDAAEKAARAGTVTVNGVQYDVDELDEEALRARAMRAANWAQIVQVLSATRSHALGTFEQSVLKAFGPDRDLTVRRLTEDQPRETRILHLAALYRLLASGRCRADLDNQPLSTETTFVSVP